MKTKLLILAALAAGLTSCATTEPTPTLPVSAYAAVPRGYKTIVTTWAKAQLMDPYSAHIEFVGEPSRYAYKDSSGRWAPCYLVTFYVNGKNAFGAYTGNKIVSVGLAGSEVVYPFGGINPMSLAL